MIETEGLVQKAAQTDPGFAAFEAMAGELKLVQTVRGKGLMIGIEFAAPFAKSSRRVDAAFEAEPRPVLPAHHNPSGSRIIKFLPLYRWATQTTP